MAILPTMIRFFLEKQDEIRFRGDLLTLGRQAVVLTPKQYEKLLGGRDNAPQVQESVTDEDVFAALGAASVESLDYSAADGASVIHDLNQPLRNRDLWGRFDMLLDGGTLEHCFNVSVYMETLLRLPKLGGTILHMNPCQGYTNHGFFNFQPTFYFDYYGANGFGDMKCWLLEFRSRNYYKFGARSRIVEVEDARRGLEFRTNRNTLVVFMATKAREVEEASVPIQGVYAH